MKKITKIENNTVAGKTRVAAYCRVSTDMADQMESLEAQKAHYDRVIKTNSSWVSAGVYFDEGISGTKKEKRPALLSLITACEDGKVDLILTKSISRFARNTTDCIELVRKLAAIGVHIYFERENINTGDMEGELMLTILSSMAEEESASISKNARWSIQKRFENGTYIIAYPPYGYRNNDGVMEIVPEEAEVVRHIFRSFLSGRSTYSIAKELHEQGMVTKRGGRWQASTVLGILKNEKYTGDVLFQKTWTDSRYNRHVNRDDYDQYLIKDHHEPLISHEIYDTVQNLIKQHFIEQGGEWGSSKYHKRYLFTGKIVCKECGKVMRRKIYPRMEGKHLMWACPTHIDDKSSCSMKAIEQEAIETAVMTMFNKLTFARLTMMKPFLSSLRGVEYSDHELVRLEKTIEDNKGERAKLMDLLKVGLIDPEFYNEENNALLSEYNKTERKLSDLKAFQNTADERLKAAEKLVRFLNQRKISTSFDDDAFREHIKDVVVYSQNVVVIRLKCGLKLSEVV